MPHTTMRRWLSGSLLCIAVLSGAAAMAAQPLPRAEAAGLIIGFKDAATTEEPAGTGQGPWATGRDSARAKWDEATR
ncbi:MAG: hypothetical protein Q8Q82_19000 [Hydrogenophaga sp.]|nr:hypothetical protein [Hydrogenophaga sp.]